MLSDYWTDVVRVLRAHCIDMGFSSLKERCLSLVELVLMPPLTNV